MSTIVLRSVKGTPLTNQEVDDNFNNLNVDKTQIGGTYSSGTANSVLYLSASKVLTSGSALTFDGTVLTSTTIDATNLEVTNIKAKDGTASIVLADTTGIATFSNATVISTTDNTNAALRITQLGTGNALLVQDENPETSPFVITGTGDVVKGHTTPLLNSTGNSYSLSVLGTTGATSGIGLGAFVASGSAINASFDFERSGTGTIGGHAINPANSFLGTIRFNGSDGTDYQTSATIQGTLDGTPAVGSMPGRILFSTTPSGTVTPVERMRIDSAGRLYLGTSSASAAGINNRWNLTGGTTTYGQINAGTIQSDVTGNANNYYSSLSTAAAAFTLTSLRHFWAVEGTIGAGSTVTNQYGFFANSDLISAANNYGFYSNLAAGTTRTISNVALTSNVVTITTSVSHGYTAGQSVTVAATTNTSVNGTFTIASVPAVNTFTYAQVATNITSVADTGSTVVVGRYSFYAAGTAENFFGGNTVISVTDNTNAALRITQLGTGNALLVEDETNPDSSPFVINNTGALLQGTTTYLFDGGASIPKLQSVSFGTNNTRIRSIQHYGSGFGPQINFANAASTTVGDFTSVVASGSFLGSTAFFGSDGVTLIQGASIAALVDGTAGANDMPGRLVFSTTADGASTSTERTRIDSAGRLRQFGTTIISNVDVLNATYDSVSFSVTAEETAPQGLFFSPDGSKMFVMGTNGDDVNEYVLSTPWVVSSATYSTVFSVSGQDGTPAGLFFRADGLKMYVVGQTNDTVFQYALTSPWSVATASYESISFSVAGQEITPTGIFFKPDGLSMYITGTTSDGIYQYTLSTAWNVSTATFLQTFSQTQDTAPQDLSFTGDGTRMFMLGSTGDDVNVYNLTTPWDISTATSVGAFSVASQEPVPSGLFIKPDGTKMYVVGTTNDTVYQYTVPSVEIQLTGKTAINGSATVAQDLTVNGDFNTSGNVGVGTTAPVTKLEIAGSNNSTWSATTTSISGTTMTIAGTVTGTIAIGDLVHGTNVQPYTRITAGSALSWTVSVSQTVASATLVGGATYSSTLIRISETDTGVSAGQPTGGLQFYTSDSSSPTAGVGAYVAALAESATPDTSLVFGTRNDAGGGVDANERMRLVSSGQLVVGHTASISLANQTNIQSYSTGAQSGVTAVRWSADDIPPRLQVGKSRSATIGTYTIVQSGDGLGGLYFYGDDGTDLVSDAASIIAFVDGTPGANDMPGRLTFNTTADGASTTTERMRIDSSGNVLIGTTTAVSGSKLVVSAADATIYGITVGRGAGAVSTNTAVGASALAANQAGGTNNTAIGNAALDANTTGDANTAVGDDALGANTTASNNTAVGYQALDANTTGADNVAVGKDALGANTTAASNTAVGAIAGTAITTGPYNTVVGYYAGAALTTGAGNTFVGSFQSGGTAGAGSAVTTGSKNVIIGGYTGSAAPISATGSNNIVLSDGDGNVRGYFDGSGSLFSTSGVICFTTSQYRSIVASSQLQFINNSAGVSLAVNGTSWGSLSDERDKEIVEPITNAVNKISTLRSVIGRYKIDDADKRRAFLIAQDVKAVLPEAVTELDDEQKTLILQYTEVIPLLVAAIKEQQALITTLTTRITALEQA